MEPKHGDLRPGKRVNIAVEIVSKSSITTESGELRQLHVSDWDGTEFSVFVTSTSHQSANLETGETYSISDLLGAEPPTTDTSSEKECPTCGGKIRSGRIIDAVGAGVLEAVSELEVEGRFGIVDERSSLRLTGDSGSAVDDWQPMAPRDSIQPPTYVCKDCGQQFEEHDFRSGQHDPFKQLQDSAAPSKSASMQSPETMGLAAGGAKDVTNFRENIENEYTPQSEAISDEGLFYDYYFETGEGSDPETLFAPRYAAAVSEHPLSGQAEQYLSVGLDSTLSVEEFERPRLDLVAVLDVSGSMDSAFDDYYYDEQGRRQEAENGSETKMEAAIDSLCALTEQLREEDRLGVVLYNNRAHVAKPLRDVGATDMPAIRRHIREISAGGGTNLADGFEAAVDLLADGTTDSVVERRMVFMTDMMPNMGETGESQLTRLFADAAADGIHTTFVGMGLDANAELADALSEIRGANHYFVHSASEFERRLGDEFDYMVTPLVYDLDLELRADGYQIEAVHGSPTADSASDQLMHVGTLFPSAKDDGEARGGVVLARLDQTESDAELSLVASWTERDGERHSETVSVDMPAETGSYAHSGVRKAVALARYADELRSWAADVHQRADAATGVDDWLLPEQRGEHERESVPLVVPEEYAERFDTLRDYLRTEQAAVGDETLQQEVDLLSTLCDREATRPREATE